MNIYREEWLYKALYIFFGYSFTLIFCWNKSWKRYILCTSLRWGDIWEIVWRQRFLPNLKRKRNWSPRKGNELNLQKSVGCIIHPLQENIYFGDAMVLWYFRGRNLALIMAGNLTVRCSMDLKGWRMVFASTAIFLRARAEIKNLLFEQRAV